MPVHDEELPNKVSRVLKLLLNGGEIKTSGETYLLSSDYSLCVKRESTNGPVLLRVNFGIMTISEFVSWASKVPDEDYLRAATEFSLANNGEKI